MNRAAAAARAAARGSLRCTSRFGGCVAEEVATDEGVEIGRLQGCRERDGAVGVVQLLLAHGADAVLYVSRISAHFVIRCMV